MFTTVVELAGFTALLLTILDVIHKRPLLHWAGRLDLVLVAAILVGLFSWWYGPDSFPISSFFR